jgi:hypothetical protein
MAFALFQRMSKVALEQAEPSLSELVRSIVDQSKVFVRAELELLKLETRQNATRAIVAFTVVLSCGFLLALALSFGAAALVLARHGSPTIALFTAAVVDLGAVLILLVATFVMLRKRSAASPSAQVLTNAPQHRTQAT